MKKALKIVLRAVSLVSLGALVLVSSLLTKIAGQNPDRPQSGKVKPEGLFSAFQTPIAFADAPGGGTTGGGDFGSSGDGGDDGGASAT